MRHFPELKNTRDGEETAASAPQEIQLPLRDRSFEGWLSLIATLFSVGEMLCFLAVAVISVVFASVVAQNGEVNMIVPLVAVGLSLVLGMVMLGYTYTRALAGHRNARHKMALRGRAGVALILCLCLGLMHPLIGAAVPLAAGLGAAAHYVLARYFSWEPAWDFLQSEAVSIMAGRDAIGKRMAQKRSTDHGMSDTVQRVGRALAIVLSLAATSYFIAMEHVSMAALAPVLIGSLWAVEALLDYAHEWAYRREAHLIPATEVRSGDTVNLDEDHPGLLVHDLSVRNQHGTTLLSQINFSVDPGTVTGVLGDSGAGKSLLLQTLIDPFALNDMEVAGGVRLNGNDLWRRRAEEQTVSAALLPEELIILPASGAENLSCFHDGPFLERARWMLEQFLFSTDLVENICAAEQAGDLPYMQRKALVLARLFALGPQLYLLDRPETGLPPRQIGVLIRRIEHEAKLGRSFVIATHDRAILEKCDRIISLQNGRVMDFGDGQDVRDRLGSGWVRMIANRSLTSDDSLRLWVRSNFNRSGDDGNRRKVGVVASNMLILSCQSADPIMPGPVHFTFKHFVGHCILRMHDSDAPISDAQLKLAKEQSESEMPDAKLTPLAMICRHCLEVEMGNQIEDRWIEAKIETYDPRKSGSKPGALNASPES